MKTAAHQYEDKLLELAYGELPSHEASAVESHVRSCARCTDALAEIRAVRNTMGQLPMEPVPDTGLESLLAYADQAARRNAAGPAPAATWWRRLMAPLMAAGALSIIGVVAYQTSKVAAPMASREDMAVRARKDEMKSETVNAAPVAAMPPPAPPAAEPEQAAQPAVWTKEAKEEAQGEAEKRPLVQEEMAPAKVAAKPSPAKKMAGPSIGDDLSKAAKISANEKRKADSNKNDDYRAMNYADTGASRDRAAQAPAADKAPSDEKQRGGAGGELAYGLKGGNPGGATQAQARPAEQNAPQAPPPPPLQAQSSASDSRTSLGLGIQPQRSVGSSAGRGDQRDFDAPATAPAQKPKDMVASLDGKMQQMKEAERSRDPESEIQAGLEVLRSAPAKSLQRLQALNALCTRFNAMEQYEKGYPFCQQLITEYPNSREAMAYAESQHRQRPAAAKRAKSYDAEEAKPSAPPEKQKAEPAKASEAY